jgi:hypothetical protein
MEQCGEVHGGEDGHEMMVIMLQLGKEEKNQVLIKANASNRFCFSDQDTIESIAIL